MAHRARRTLAVIAVVWATVTLLSGLGVAAAVGRAVFVADLTSRAEPVRQRLMAAWDRDDPLSANRPAELAEVDGRFARYQP
jgi:hypothetical protein